MSAVLYVKIRLDIGE